MPAKKKIKVQDLKPKKDAKGGVNLQGESLPGHDNAGPHKPLNNPGLNAGTHGSTHTGGN